jgi:hypothetical protein
MVPRNIIGKASQVLGKVPEGIIKAIEYYRSSEMAIPLVIDGIKRYKNQVPVNCPYDTRETICETPLMPHEKEKKYGIN